MLCSYAGITEFQNKFSGRHAAGLLENGKDDLFRASLYILYHYYVHKKYMRIFFLQVFKVLIIA